MAAAQSLFAVMAAHIEIKVLNTLECKIEEEKTENRVCVDST